VLHGRRISLTLLVEAGSRAGAGAAVLAVVPGCRTHHETALQIRVVA